MLGAQGREQLLRIWRASPVGWVWALVVPLVHRSVHSQDCRAEIATSVQWHIAIPEIWTIQPPAIAAREKRERPTVRVTSTQSDIFSASKPRHSAPPGRLESERMICEG